MPPQGPRGQQITPRRTTQAKIDSPGIKCGQRSKLFRNHQRRMVRQHDSARPDTDALGPTGDMTNHHRGRGAGDSGKVVMFRQPIAVITPALGMLGEIEGVAKGERRVATLNDRRQVEKGKMLHRSLMLSRRVQEKTLWNPRPQVTKQRPLAEPP